MFASKIIARLRLVASLPDVGISRSEPDATFVFFPRIALAIRTNNNAGLSQCLKLVPGKRTQITIHGLYVRIILKLYTFKLLRVPTSKLPVCFDAVYFGGDPVGFEFASRRVTRILPALLKKHHRNAINISEKYNLPFFRQAMFGGKVAVVTEYYPSYRAVKSDEFTPEIFDSVVSYIRRQQIITEYSKSVGQYKQELLNICASEEMKRHILNKLGSVSNDVKIPISVSHGDLKLSNIMMSPKDRKNLRLIDYELMDYRSFHFDIMDIYFGKILSDGHAQPWLYQKMKSEVNELNKEISPASLEISHLEAIYLIEKLSLFCSSGRWHGDEVKCVSSLTNACVGKEFHG